MRQNCPAEDIAKRAPHRNRGAKERQNTSAHLEREKIGQNGRRGRSVAAFTNADQYPGRKKHGKSNGQIRTPPLARLQRITADPINQPARKAVGQPTENGRTEHVRDEKSASPSVPLIAIAFTFVAEKKVRANLPVRQRRENLPVDVIEHVDGEE